MENKKKNYLPLIIILSIVAVLVAGVMVVASISIKNAIYESWDESYQVVEDDDEEDETKKPPVPSTQAPTQKPTQTATEVPTQAPEEDLDEMTVIVYMIGSNLERESGLITRDIQEMINADINDNINIVVQAGGCSDWKNSAFTDGSTHRMEIVDAGYTNLTNLGKKDMTNDKTLSDFIKYSVNKFPAKKYTLLLWNHGGGIPMGYGSDDMFPGSTMTDVELKKALDTANVHFDTIVFNACLMATLEVSMAVKDHADYMIAAESTIINGMTYEKWLESIATNPNMSSKYHANILMTNYMNMIRQNDLVSSISMIDLSKVNAVYNAYAEYSATVYSDIMNHGYENYYKKRGACGVYEGSDSVDLITLAKTYQTTKSSKLISAVKAAVVYSDSDYLYGNGLAVYSPYKYVTAYNQGRASLKSLGYSENILKCYDAYCSISLKYMGDSEVSQYAGSWYDVAAVEHQIGANVSKEPKEYELALTDKNGQKVLKLTDEDWAIVDEVMVNVILQKSSNSFLMLGRDYYDNVDEDGAIIAGLPEAWVHISGVPACYICVDEYVNDETGEWSQLGTIMATRNGKDILMLIYYSEEYPSGTIVGYMEYDFETQQGEKYVYKFNADDVIALIHPTITTDGNIQYTNVLNKTIKYSNIELTYEEISFEGYVTGISIELTDIYGNEYDTPSVVFR